MRLRPERPIPLAGVARMELGGYAEIPTAPAPRASLVLITTSPQATDPNSGPTLAGRLIPGGTITSATLELRLEPHSR